ncbi:hypothetical protein DB347_15515 [Opitutaceae bacterium EW11]|nr:hypothetical protein DB347_15515 [Opitutaceae bacterium EW11]
MPSLTLFGFAHADGAEAAAWVIAGLERRRLVSVVDAAIVSRRPGDGGFKTGHLQVFDGPEALDGAFWKRLFRSLPEASGGEDSFSGDSGILARVGIDPVVLAQVRDKLSENSSVLFVVCRDGAEKQLGTALGRRGIRFERITVPLAVHCSGAEMEPLAAGK